MDHVQPAQAGHRAPRVALFFASSAGTAVAFAAAMRATLPYENFGRYTPEAQFFMWEGVVWMLGLALLCWGGAAVFETLHLGRMEGTMHGTLQDLRPRRLRFSPVPWWLLSTGAVLLALAIQARASLPG